MPNDLMSIGTAANVLGNYTLELTDEVLAIVVLFVCHLQIFLALRHPRARRRWRHGWAAERPPFCGCGCSAPARWSPNSSICTSGAGRRTASTRSIWKR